MKGAWANTQGLGSHCFFPLRLHLSLSDSSYSGPPLPAEVPRRLHSQEGGFSWGPQHQRTWRKVTFPRSSWPEGQSTILGCTRVYGPSQGKPDGTCWRGGSVKGTWPDCLDPSPPTHGTQTCSGSRGWKAAQVREIGGNKIDIALFFSLISRRCYVGLHLICSVVLVVNEQAPVSVMTFTHSTSVLQVFAIEMIQQSQVTSLGWILCLPLYLFWVYVTPRTVTHYVPLSMEFYRHKYWSR